MTTLEVEQEAIQLYRDGEYATARNLFEKLEHLDAANELHSFNKACCHAAEGDIPGALDILLDNNRKLVEMDETVGPYNVALCLLSLNRADLALAAIHRMKAENRIPSRPELRGVKLELVRLMMHCMSRVDQTNLTKTQCQQMYDLLCDYKAEMLELLDSDEAETAWRTNLAHVLFAMDTRYGDCAKELEILKSSSRQSSSLSDDAKSIIRANLCLSYILTRRNKEAVGLLSEFERSEPTTVAPGASPRRVGGRRMSCGVLTNLAIATWYCVENNYAAGLARIFKSLEPLDERLTSDAWAQAKRCILSALDKHCRRVLHLEDLLFDQTIDFLVECESRGLLLPASRQRGLPGSPDAGNSVAYEARFLRSVLLAILHD